MKQVNMAVIPEFDAEVLDVRETESGGVGLNIMTEAGLLGLYASRQALQGFRPRVGEVVRLRIAASGIWQGDIKVTLMGIAAVPAASAKSA